MENGSFGPLDALIQEKVESDADFNANIATLSDDEKAEALKSKKQELFEQELATLKEKAERAEKAEELANNYKIRAEKAEGKTQKEPKPQPQQHEETLSAKDALYLAKANIDIEDADHYVALAKFYKVSLSEAHKHPEIKAAIDTRVEQRKTAFATQTKSTKTTTKVTGDALIERAQQNQFPEKDEDIAKLAQAEVAAKKAGLKR